MLTANRDSSTTATAVIYDHQQFEMRPDTKVELLRQGGLVMRFGFT